MALLKKLVFFFFVSMAMISTTTAEEITKESVMEALNTTIETADEVAIALQNGEKADKIENLYRKIKETIKQAVVSDSTVAVPRSKGNSRTSASRRAFRKGDIEKAIKLAIEAADQYKKARSKVKYK